MASFGGLILTNTGRNLQTKAQAGTALHFTRIAIGDGELNGTAIITMNALKNQRKTMEIAKLRVLSEGQAIVGCVFSNQDISTGFYFREIGVFAQDPDVGEVLYCYANAGATADYIPAGSSGGTDLVEKTIDVVTLVGNTASVTATINQSLVYETPEGAQQKATAARDEAMDHADQILLVHMEDGTVHVSSAERTSWNGKETPAGAQLKIDHASYKTAKSSKDANGIFTTVEYRRKSDNTLVARSVLSGGTSPAYTTRAVTFYAANGTTVSRTDTFTLSYDADGDLISEV